VVLSDFAGVHIATESFDTPADPPALVAELASRVNRMVSNYAADGSCEGIGIVVPGMVDQRDGRVLNAPQLGWRDVHIRDVLADATGLPVHIENAPIACAIAQMWLGERGADAGDFAYVTVSDGVGVGVVVNGQVLRGHGFTAGEFGHVPIHPEGERCLCGARGCWEAYTSNLATLSRYLGVELAGPDTRRALRRSGLTLAELISRARNGDARAADAIRETGHNLGLGLAMLVNGLNPARIFVGGEITAAWDMIEGCIRSAIQDRALSRDAAATPIIPEQAGAQPRLRGATALVAAPLFAAPRVG
jgi:predicted NBD/HSP70 family sugar kinase